MMTIYNSQMIMLVSGFLTLFLLGIAYSIFVLLERRQQWPPHYQPYGFVQARSGLMGNRASALYNGFRTSRIIAINPEKNASDFSDKW